MGEREGLTPEARERASQASELASCIDGFCRHLAEVRNLSPNTVRAYRTDLGSYLDWVRREGILPLDVTHRELRGYLGELSRAGYSSRTIGRRLSSLRGLYRWMVREGRCASEAASALASPKGVRTLPRAMTDAEVRTLLGTCEGDDPASLRDRALLELLYASGARVSEAAGLLVTDIDLDRAQVRLFGKGSKERIVPLYGEAVRRVRRYLERGRPALAARSRKATSALFLSVRGNAMSADALRTRFERRVSEAGLDPSLTPHAMRHAFATELVGGGADLRSVQELLGHESLSTTQVYTHLSVERLKDAALRAHPRSRPGS